MNNEHAALIDSVYCLGKQWIEYISGLTPETLNEFRKDFKKHAIPCYEDMQTRLAYLEGRQREQLHKVDRLDRRLDTLNWECTTIEETELLTDQHSLILIESRQLEQDMSGARELVAAYQQVIESVELVIAAKAAWLENETAQDTPQRANDDDNDI